MLLLFPHSLFFSAEEMKRWAMISPRVQTRDTARFLYLGNNFVVVENVYVMTHITSVISKILL
jgi:hypothetical protein